VVKALRANAGIGIAVAADQLDTGPAFAHQFDEFLREFLRADLRPWQLFGMICGAAIFGVLISRSVRKDGIFAFFAIVPAATLASAPALSRMIALVPRAIIGSTS
jgi:hypothetical protein